MGGLHVTALPQEAAAHADRFFIGPGEDTWPQFLADYRAGASRGIYQSQQRNLIGVPPLRRALIKGHLYLVPHSMVVSLGCPHIRDFCHKTFWTILKLGNRPSRPRSSTACAGWRVWQAAGTIKSVLVPNLVEKAAACGLKSLVIDLETLDPNSLKQQRKHQNLPCDYGRTIAKLHNLDVLVNASFVFGLEGDNEGVFVRATEWAIARGIETATFRIPTPYPGTALYERMAGQGRLLHRHWDLCDTRHAVFRPARMTPDRLEEGY